MPDRIKRPHVPAEHRPEDPAHITHQAVVWRQVGPTSDSQEEAWECLAYPSVKIAYYDPDGGIFRGWCVMCTGCGVYRSEDPDVTKDEALNYGNRYAAARAEERLRDAQEALDEAQERYREIEHIRPLGG